MYDSKVMNVIQKLKWFKVTNWADSSEQHDWLDTRNEVDSLDDANVVSSRLRDSAKEWVHHDGVTYHKLIIDLDLPAYLVPSSTPGHSHLYIDKDIPEAAYFNLLEALARANILEHGYVAASIDRGASFLRFPWVQKEF